MHIEVMRRWGGPTDLANPTLVLPDALVDVVLCAAAVAEEKGVGGGEFRCCHCFWIAPVQRPSLRVCLDIVDFRSRIG